MSAPVCPDHLGELARLEWVRMSADLGEKLMAVDAPALAAYCVAYGRWKEAELNIQKYGTVIRTGKGEDAKPTISPYIAVAEKSLEIMKQWLVELECTPKSRSSHKSEGWV
jgi:P27 family predicted phage terminase small subunit